MRRNIIERFCREVDHDGAPFGNKKVVTLQRKHASLWRRYAFPAPPMQTNEEARWLAAQLRRALLMFGGLR